eukprot:GHVS01093367.1.p1 GENE.GHVS01093367.1~~GHVS01093367.1.p1  ORF type:complete len:147 (+),score=23.59 GHVS01093367.1:145-585(+)
MQTVPSELALDAPLEVKRLPGDESGAVWQCTVKIPLNYYPEPIAPAGTSRLPSTAPTANGTEASVLALGPWQLISPALVADAELPPNAPQSGAVPTGPTAPLSTIEAAAGLEASPEVVATAAPSAAPRAASTTTVPRMRVPLLMDG